MHIYYDPDHLVLSTFVLIICSSKFCLFLRVCEYVVIRVVVALWVSFDDIYRGAGASESSLCAGLARVGWGSYLPYPCKLGDFLFI
jgi:hypothetical protein